MTLLLKSKSISAGSVGNIHGNTGPQDYVVMLDFSRGEYFTNVGGTRTDYAVTDVLSVERSAPANYQDRYGSWRQAPSNSPRFKFSPENDGYGLFVGDTRQNFATSASDGSSVTVSASASAEILLSWEGSGSATLTHANLAEKELTTYRGRTMRRYTRTVAGAFTAILNVSGSVSNLQVERAALLLYPSERLGYGETCPADAVTLKSPLVGLIGGNGTILVRTMAPDAIIDATTNYTQAAQMIGLRTGNVDGGIYLNAADGVVVRPNSARTVANGAAFNTSTGVTFNVSGRPTGTVRGLGWTDYGAEITGMTGGMFLTTTGLTSLGAFNQVRIGGSSTPGDNINGIVTHIVIYDRHLSYDEMSVMATMWQN